MKPIIKTIITVAIFTTAAFGSLSAKTLEIKVSNVRNNKGNILVMAHLPGSEQPVYQMIKAQEGTVTITLNLNAETAEISLMHDENSDYKMGQDETGRPTEGYALQKCKLPQESTSVTLELTYLPAFK